MAINPNTDFSPGAILTASQQNRFPRGIVAYAESTANTAGYTAEIVTSGNATFTAVANRYYRITYYEPVIAYNSGTVNRVELNIRLTNISGAIQTTSAVNPTTNRSFGIASVVKTFTAGSVTVVGTSQVASGGGVANNQRAAAQASYIMVEDLGPA